MREVFLLQVAERLAGEQAAGPTLAPHESSVLRTGLLPAWEVGLNGEVFDCSGLAPFEPADYKPEQGPCEHLDTDTAHFVRLAQKLYSRSLGPWCAVEVMSVDWMRALAEAFAVHFPQFAHESYFEDCFSHQVEERHAQESLEVTQMVLRERPELLAETLRDAKMMAEALDGVWSNLDRVVQAARRRARRF